MRAEETVATPWGGGQSSAEILLVGLNHRTAAVDLRERVTFDSEQACKAAEELRSRGILQEAVVLSTCNRSELYGVPPEAASSGMREMESFLASFHQVEPTHLNGSLYSHRNRDAVRHLFQVAAGLDSMLLGEAEILGQVREAYRLALARETTGPVLNRMFQGALEVGKRVRSETEIGANPMSAAFAGVKLAERVFGNLRGHSALILGAGAMGEKVAEHLQKRGIARLCVTNRSRERGEDLAARLAGEFVEWNTLSDSIQWPDIVVCSVGGADRVLTRSMIERAMGARRNRAMFIMDLGVPRNVEPDVSELYNLYLYNVDDLTGIVEQNKKAREQEIPRAQAIIDEHIAKFEAWHARLPAVSLLKQLRAKLDHERDAFLRECSKEMPHLSAEDRRRIGQLSEELLERVVLEPAERLHHSQELQHKHQLWETLRELFKLGREKT